MNSENCRMYRKQMKAWLCTVYEMTLDEDGVMIVYESKTHNAQIMNTEISEHCKLQVLTVK